MGSGTGESTAAEVVVVSARVVGRIIPYLLDGPEIKRQPDDNDEKSRDYGEGFKSLSAYCLAELVLVRVWGLIARYEDATPLSTPGYRSPSAGA